MSWSNNSKEYTYRSNLVLTAIINQVFHAIYNLRYLFQVHRITVIMWEASKVHAQNPVPNARQNRNTILLTCKHRTYLLEKPRSFNECSSRFLTSCRPAVMNLKKKVKKNDSGYRSNLLKDIQQKQGIVNVVGKWKAWPASKNSTNNSTKSCQGNRTYINITSN